MKYIKQFNENMMGFEDIDIIQQVLVKNGIEYKIKDDSIFIIKGLEYDINKYKSVKEIIDNIEKDNS